MEKTSRVNLGSPIWSGGDLLSVCCSFFLVSFSPFPKLSVKCLSSPAFFSFVFTTEDDSRLMRRELTGLKPNVLAAVRVSVLLCIFGYVR